MNIDIFVTSGPWQAVLQAQIGFGPGLPVVLQHKSVNQGLYQRGLQAVFRPFFGVAACRFGQSFFQRDKQGWRYRIHHGHVTRFEMMN